jgi:hypothetical protein
MYIKKGNVEVFLDEKGIEKKINKSLDRTQYLLDNKVQKDTSPYVPMLTGELDRSVIPSAQSGKGLLVYSMKYARRLYYNLGFNFTKTFHPKAGAFWFEVSKKINKKSWIKFAKGGFKKWWKN